jgi:membrane protease YdiL (CAAX protease family)
VATLLVNAATIAVAQLLLFAGVPLLAYTIYHKWRHKRPWSEIAKRAGLAGCPRRYLLWSAVLALAGVVAIAALSPPIELFTQEGSALRPFVGLGLGPTAIVLALLYGAVQTGLAEEVLFRGLIAGSLSRRLSMFWANVTQALIFLLPHLLILYVMPKVWPLLSLVFVGALVFGWLRIKSGSIIGPWLMHASGNVAIALSVAFHTAT